MFFIHVDASLTFRMQVLYLGCRSYISGASLVFRMQVLNFWCEPCISGASLVFRVQVLYFGCKSCSRVQVLSSGASLVVGSSHVFKTGFEVSFRMAILV